MAVSPDGKEPERIGVRGAEGAAAAGREEEEGCRSGERKRLPQYVKQGK